MAEQMDLEESRTDRCSDPSPGSAGAPALSIATVSDVYSRAPALGLSEGQAHWLAEVLVRSPGAALRVDGALLELSLPGRAPVLCVTGTLPALMPFGAGAADPE